MSDMLRITGMASGLDVDGMVQKLMKAETMKVDKVKQDRQIIQWQQDSYRDTLSDLSTLKSTYFDVLKPDTNMLSSNTYAGFDITSSDVNNTIITAKAGANAAAGTYKLKVNQVATGAIKEGTALTAGGSTATLATKLSDLGLASDKSINITYNGTTKSIAVKTTDTINSVIQNISSATLGNVVAKFSELTGKFSIQTSATGSSNTLSYDDFSELGLTNAATNTISGILPSTPADTNTTLETLGMATGTSINIKLNDGTGDKQITLQDSDSIQGVINKIKALGNFDASYDSVANKFSIKTTNGRGFSIDKDITALGITAGTVAGGTVTGKDAIVEITPPGSAAATTVTKSNNAFSIDGISYSVLQKDTNTVVSLTVTPNVQKSFDKIKAFIDKYNDTIDKISKKIEEKKQKGFPPLTDDQRKAMKDEEIKTWEGKAKEGLLRNDSSLENMLTSMRTAFFDSIQGVGLSLRDLGMSTSSDISERGKIVFDPTLGGEQKLKDALQNKGQQVVDMFTKSSSIAYSPNLSAADRKARNSTEGIFQRISDILQDYTRTTRDNSGKKGILLEKAGIKGDFTEFNNLLTKQLNDKDKIITDLTRKLSDKENSYYTQFSKLEQAMNNMNSQSSWLAQQLGGGK